MFIPINDDPSTEPELNKKVWQNDSNDTKNKEDRVNVREVMTKLNAWKKVNTKICTPARKITSLVRRRLSKNIRKSPLRSGDFLCMEYKTYISLSRESNSCHIGDKSLRNSKYMRITFLPPPLRVGDKKSNSYIFLVASAIITYVPLFLLPGQGYID